MADRFGALTNEESIGLLRSRDFGRLAVVVDDVPLVFPVNYAIDEGSIVIRTASGTKWEAAEDRMVSFEVDELDLSHRSVWSVLVVGKARHAELEGASHAHPLVPGEKPSVIRIAIERITGRRLSTDADVIEMDPRGYL